MIRDPTHCLRSNDHLSEVGEAATSLYPPSSPLTNLPLPLMSKERRIYRLHTGANESFISFHVKVNSMALQPAALISHGPKKRNYGLIILISLLFIEEHISYEQDVILIHLSLNTIPAGLSKSGLQSAMQNSPNP